jgi:transcriptional regulator with XRE-family HTH domain
MAEKSEQIEENLVKKTCRELGITQKELAKYFNVTAQTVSNWAKDIQIGKLEKTTEMALMGMLYKKKLDNIKENLI